MNVNIILYDDFDALDVFGSATVFGKVPEHFHLKYLSVTGDIINSVQGSKIWTDVLIPEEINGIVIIPGGKGARRLLWTDERSMKLMKRAVENADFCLMVENGTALVAQTGLLYHRRIADYPADENWNRMFTAEVDRIKNTKIVVDGKFYSCNNSISGIDMALWAIADVLDIAIAEKVASALGYLWDMNSDDIMN